MNNNHKVMTAGLLPDMDLVRDNKAARFYSLFCEETCSNLFAFSPYQLRIEREEFLNFQYLADELKSLVEDEEVSYADIAPLCRKLNSVYKSIVENCWEAFICNPDINADPGKFIVQQLVVVDDFTKNANLCKKPSQSGL